MQWFKGNPTALIYGGILLLLLLGTFATKSPREKHPATKNGDFLSIAEQTERQLSGWERRQEGTRTSLRNGNMKVVVSREPGNPMLLVAYLLTESTKGAELLSEMTAWTLLAGTVDAAAMDWVIDECIPVLTKSKEREINGFQCNYSIAEDYGSYWCILAFRTTTAPIAKNRPRLPASPPASITADVKRRVDAGMRRSGYFRFVLMSPLPGKTVSLR